MADESETKSQKGERDARSERRSSVALGLIAAPEIPEEIANDLAAELSELLGKHVDDSVSWDVSVIVDPLTGTNLEAPEILDVCRDRSRREGWDLAVCLTDLPVHRSGHTVVADASADRGVGGISLPALGATRLRPRVQEMTVQLVYELYARLGPDSRGEQGDAETADGAPALPGPRPRDLVERRPAELVAPFRRVEPPDEDMRQTGVDARFISPGLLGNLRLLSGMVLANRPWQILPSFKGTLAAAFATAAYVLVIPTIWMLADAVGWPRLLALMVAAVVAMVVWIILAHHLWERPSSREERRWATLYNGVTALTISMAVLVAYAVLFTLVFLAAWIFVPGQYFQSTLKHPVSVADFLILAWMATSLATVAGAIGSSLEHEETVRSATYGYRQRRRQESLKEDSDE